VNHGAGVVWVNCSQPAFVQAPWGGMKKSGIGRELGPWGLDTFLEIKQACPPALAHTTKHLIPLSISRSAHGRVCAGAGLTAKMEGCSETTVVW
jgi:hypothetical protein